MSSTPPPEQASEEALTESVLENESDSVETESSNEKKMSMDERKAKMEELRKRLVSQVVHHCTLFTDCRRHLPKPTEHP